MPRIAHSTVTVAVAFCANLAVAVAKTVAAIVSGSASMVAESAHSWADTGNQVFLLVADNRARRPPDEERPWGYGREAYVWSLFAALGLFVAGGVVSVYHGITELNGEEVETRYTLAYVVLAMAFLFEGVSFAQAVRQTHREASELGRDLLDHALTTSDPTLRAVLAEDSAALIGIVIAALGLGLHQLTGQPVYDALGSILVGLMLCGIAVLLVDRNRRFLAGQVADPEIHDAAVDRVRRLPGVLSVSRLHLEYVGPRQLFLLCSVDLDGDRPESEVATRLDELEKTLEQDPRIVHAVLTLAAPSRL